jgi:hypothetical protein
MLKVFVDVATYSLRPDEEGKREDVTSLDV